MTDDVILKALMTHIIADKYGMDSEELVRARALLAAGASEGQEPIYQERATLLSSTWFDVSITEYRERLDTDGSDWVRIVYLHPSAEIAALRERIAGMEKDAERWRKALETGWLTSGDVKKIDAAIATEKQG